MREFGSDFHCIDIFNSGSTYLPDVFRGAKLLADGRQCIIVLIRQYGWKRLWMPDYFCYEVVDTIKEQTGIQVMFYADSPLAEGSVESLPYEKGDALLRMNFFGMRDVRSNREIPVPVIEDHSHDPFGRWALCSDADWCISSIRKTLPLPEGGMMWSPKGYKLTSIITATEENEQIASTRWEGMELKSRYLQGETINKEVFRKRYTETEDWFEHATPVIIDRRSEVFISEQFDINFWFGAKKRNWTLLQNLLKDEQCTILTAEREACAMFSLVIILESQKRRDVIRKELIENAVYPAILWSVPNTASVKSIDFSQRMLSIHCDGRYSDDDIIKLASIIKNVLENN